MSTKVAPIESFALAPVSSSASSFGPHRALPRTSLNDRTCAERLKDLRNDRREEDKRENTFPGLALATIRRYFYSERLPDFASLRRGMKYAENSVSSAKQKKASWLPHSLRFP